MNKNYKKKILILNGQYIPGYKGGGPIRSCVNLIENLSDEFEFYVLCSDRDFKSDKSYENIKINDWNQIGKANVYYMSPDKQNIKGFKGFFESIDFDILYLNGFFSPIFTIKPLILRLLGGLKEKKIILTPRGDFTGGCENKKIKKYSYIYICKMMGLYKDILWHATSNIEYIDIKKKFNKANVFTVPNLSARYTPKEIKIHKIVGSLKIAFISRIFPKKNLKFALEILKEINEGNIVFDIYGPMEDMEYWEECNKLIYSMPSNIKITYKGEVEHWQIEDIFSRYELFLFPTLGENYGHVIVEAMMNNCICLLSKGVTPWDDYNNNGGFVESLSNKQGFIDIIKNLINLDNKEFNKYILETQKYIKKKIANDKYIEKYYNEFNKEE